MAEDRKDNGAPEATFDRQTLERIIEVIQSLNGGISNARRYPPGSAVIEMVLKRCTEAFAGLSETIPTVTIAGSDGKLIINDVVADERTQKKSVVQSFIQLIEQKGVRSLTLRKGLLDSEVAKLLYVLGSTEEELREHGGIVAYMKDLEIEHVAIDEKVYVAITTEQTVVDKAELERLLEGGGKVDVNRVQQGVFVEYLLKKLNIPGVEVDPEQLRSMSRKDYPALAEKIATAIESRVSEEVEYRDGKAYDAAGEEIPETEDPALHQLRAHFEKASRAIQTLPDEAVRKKSLADLTKVMASFGGETLAGILSARVGDAAEEINLKGYLLAQTSAEKKNEVVDEMIARYRRFVEGSADESERLADGELKEAGRVLKTLVHREKQAAKDGTPSESLAKMEQALGIVHRLEKDSVQPSGTLTEQAGRVIALPLAAAVAPAERERLKELVVGLVSDEHIDLTREIVEKFAAGLHDPTPETRRASLETLLKINAALLQSVQPQLAQVATRQILQNLAVEDDTANRELGATSIGIHLASHVVNRNYPAINEMLDTLERMQSDAGKRAVMQGVLRQVGTDDAARAVLIEDFQSEDEAVATRATRMTGMMPAETVVPAFIDLLGESESMRVRKACLRTLARFGRPALPILLDRLAAKEPEKPWFLIRNLVGVAGEIGGADAFDEIVAHVDHEDARVRKAVHQACTQIRTPRAINVLTDGLEDPDLSVRRLIVTFFGVHKESAAVSDLIRILEAAQEHPDAQNEPLAADACVALGRIGDPKAVAALVELAKPEGLKGLFKKRKSERLVEAAIRALGDLRAEEAEALVARYIKDSNPAIAKAAQDALRRISEG